MSFTKVTHGIAQCHEDGKADSFDGKTRRHFTRLIASRLPRPILRPAKRAQRLPQLLVRVEKRDETRMGYEVGGLCGLSL